MNTNKCSVNPTNITPREYKELLADHVLSGIRKTHDGLIYKPNPHNVTGDQINVKYTSPISQEEYESTVKEAIEATLQAIIDKYNDKKVLTVRVQEVIAPTATHTTIYEYDSITKDVEIDLNVITTEFIDSIL